jgi:hypothetical protein
MMYINTSIAPQDSALHSNARHTPAYQLIIVDIGVFAFRVGFSAAAALLPVISAR